MSPKTDDLDRFGRFSEPAVMILVSLAESPKHGYAITDDIERITGHRPGPGTLSGAIARLESQGFIKSLKADHHRVPYALTVDGTRALKARLDAMSRVSRVGFERLART